MGTVRRAWAGIGKCRLSPSPSHSDDAPLHSFMVVAPRWWSARSACVCVWFPAPEVHQVPITESGMLCGYGIWWAADLGNGHVLSSAPKSPQRSWKQLVRWLDEPRFVSEGGGAEWGRRFMHGF